MVFISALIIFILIILASAVKIAREYERGVVFRLGRLILPPKGPGIFLIIPVVDRMIKISLRTVVMDVPMILNTANTNYKDDFMSWGADAYVVKSDDLEELKAKVREILGELES